MLIGCSFCGIVAVCDVNCGYCGLANGVGLIDRGLMTSFEYFNGWFSANIIKICEMLNKTLLQ